MKTIFYTTTEDTTSTSLKELVTSVIPREQLEICRSIEKLEQLLCQPNFRFGLAVFNINNLSEIEGLIGLKNLMDDIRIILVIPDVERETVYKGHKLYPRFMTDRLIDMNHLGAIIKRNLDNLMARFPGNISHPDRRESPTTPPK